MIKGHQQGNFSIIWSVYGWCQSFLEIYGFTWCFAEREDDVCEDFTQIGIAKWLLEWEMSYDIVQHLYFTILCYMIIIYGLPPIGQKASKIVKIIFSEKKDTHYPMRVCNLIRKARYMPIKQVTTQGRYD